MSLSLIIDPNNGCNLNCIHCGLKRPHLVHFSKQTVMSTLAYRRMLEMLKPYVSSCSLGCIREPLVHPQIKELIQITDQTLHLGRLTLSTNGVLLDEELVELFLAARNAWQINLSVESCRPEIYAAIRRGARFDIFQKNLDLIKSVKKTRHDMRILFSAVIMKNNLNAYAELFDYAGSQTVDFLKPMRLLVHEDNSRLALSKNEEQFARETLLKMKAVSKDRFTQMDFSQYDDPEMNPLRSEQYPFPPHELIVNHLGYVYPPGCRDPLGCIFKSEDLPRIFGYYGIH